MPVRMYCSKHHGIRFGRGIHHGWRFSWRWRRWHLFQWHGYFTLGLRQSQQALAEMPTDMYHTRFLCVEQFNVTFCVMLPTVNFSDPRLGHQCVAGRPFYLFETRLSSCSSTRACGYIVGSADSTTSIATTPPEAKLSPSLHLDVGCFLLQPTMIVPSRQMAQASLERDLEVH